MAEAGPRIAVIGSSNMDLVIQAARIPAVGETVLGGEFVMVPGGKGANQAVAAARLGADVLFIARLGRDLFASRSMENFRDNGVDTRYVLKTARVPSGVALIMVDKDGGNSILVAPGANSHLMPDDVHAAREDIALCGAVVAQLEVPIETVEYTAELASELGIPFILDPAPACELNAELLSRVDVLTPNESEATALTGMHVHDRQTAAMACERVLAKGVKTVIVTMGAEGFVLGDDEGTAFVEPCKVEAVDSTAAGDAFTGSLAMGIAMGQSVRQASRLAGNVAALSVTKMGAQSSMPTRQEIERFMEQ